MGRGTTPVVGSAASHSTIGRAAGGLCPSTGPSCNLCRCTWTMHGSSSAVPAHWSRIECIAQGLDAWRWSELPGNTVVDQAMQISVRPHCTVMCHILSCLCWIQHKLADGICVVHVGGALLKGSQFINESSGAMLSQGGVSGCVVRLQGSVRSRKWWSQRCDVMMCVTWECTRHWQRNRCNPLVPLNLRTKWYW